MRTIERHRERLKVLAVQLLAGRETSRIDSSDIVQETVLKGLKWQTEYRGASDQELAAWLDGILRNQIVDVVRHSHRGVRDVRREVPYTDAVCSKSPTASQAARTGETHAAVREALLALTPEYREVLLLRQQYDLSFTEIGERMGRSPNAVRMLWSRALVALGKKLGNDESGNSSTPRSD